MKRNYTKTLNTERLILRKFTEDDFLQSNINWQSDELMTKYLTWKASADIEVTSSFLKGVIANYDSIYQWAIELKETKEVIGTISSVRENESIGEVTLGYCIGSRWWGKGYMTEAATEVLRYFFEEEGILRVSSSADVENIASQKVLRKIGLRHEGTMKKASRNNRGIVDTMFFGLILEDYMEGISI